MKTKKYLQTKERSISFIDVGNKQHQTMVFLPGFPLTKESWYSQIEYFSTSYRVISFDYSGLGESSLMSGFVTIDSHVSDLIAVLNHNKVDKFSLIGLSMGGYIALRAVNRFPERIQALVLANTRADADSNTAKTKRFDQINLLQSGGSHSFSDTLAHALLSENFQQRSPESLKSLKETISKQPLHGLCANLIAMAARYESTEFLSGIKCPVLIITGDNDAVIPHDEGQKMHDKIERSSIVKLKNCGHLSNWEQPELFSKSIESFINSQ